MIIPEQKPFLSPQRVAAMAVSIFTVGIIALLGLAIAALLFVAYLFNIAIAAIVEVSTNFTQFYSHSDNVTRLIVWLVAFLFLYKLTPSVARFVRPARSK